MVLTITSTQPPATDLGYLLHKHPAHLQSFALPFGQAHVFYPEASEHCCTAALLLDVDPIGMVRGRRGSAGRDSIWQQYVNDRPYVASSLLSVAISRVFGSALQGKCNQQPELAERPMPLRARLAVVSCRDGETLLRRLFEPLGYRVELEPHALDEQVPEWGQGEAWTLTIEATVRLRDLLTHLYVLIPVLDDEKHYWIGDAEVDKLLRFGEGWLPAHPERELIARRYLRFRGLAREAMNRLMSEEAGPTEERELRAAAAEENIEQPMRLNQQRLEMVCEELRSCGARRVLDLGCGEGRLIRLLLEDRQFQEITGLDVSWRTVQRAAQHLRIEDRPTAQRERVRLLHGALTYRDRRLEGYDAAAVVEVIEHLDPPRLRAVERVVFECARPKTVVVTTPNAEYNVLFDSLPAGQFRHSDHRFEWTRREFEEWAQSVASRFGYRVRFRPVGPAHAMHGAPTQMGIFEQ